MTDFTIPDLTEVDPSTLTRDSLMEVWNLANPSLKMSVVDLAQIMFNVGTINFLVEIQNDGQSSYIGGDTQGIYINPDATMQLSSSNHSRFDFNVDNSIDLVADTNHVVMLIGADGTLTIKSDNNATHIILAPGGALSITGLPTSDPHVVGQVWSNVGIMTISAG